MHSDFVLILSDIGEQGKAAHHQAAELESHKN
jgi:hypothetical protein